MPVFQFSPPHRGHHRLKPQKKMPSSFNSRPRTGGIIREYQPLIMYDVSILAPAQGAYVGSNKAIIVIESFNSRPRTGGIDKWLRYNISNPMFQFSPPHRGHLCIHIDIASYIIVSILAPAQGASTFKINFILLLKCFNSRPRTGGIEFLHTPSEVPFKFQFSPPHRGHLICNY